MKLGSKHILDGWEVYTRAVSPSGMPQRSIDPVVAALLNIGAEAHPFKCLPGIAQCLSLFTYKKSGHNTSLLRSERTRTIPWRHIGAEAPFSAQVWWSNLAKHPQSHTKNLHFNAILYVFINYPQSAYFWLRVMPSILSQKVALSGSLVLAFLNKTRVSL